MTSKQRSRHAFIRDAKREFNLSQKSANELYTKWSNRYGGIVRASDLKSHPRIAASLANQVQGGDKRSQGRSVRTGANPSGETRITESSGRLSGGRVVKNRRDWNDVYDYYDFEPVEYESSADYGEV